MDFIYKFAYLNAEGYTPLLLILLSIIGLFNKYRSACLQMLSIMNILLAITGSIWMVNFVIELISLPDLPDDSIERYDLLNRMFGPYWWAFWITFIGTIVVPQLFWLEKYRKRIWFSIIVALAFQSEHVLVFLTSFLRDYLPSSWAMSYGHTFGYFAAYTILVTMIYLLKERFNKIAL